MPDVHHNVEAQLKRLRQREVTVSHCDPSRQSRLKAGAARQRRREARPQNFRVEGEKMAAEQGSKISTLMPLFSSFKAINDPNPVPTSPPISLPDPFDPMDEKDEELPSPRTLIPSKDEQAADICHRDWAVLIKGKQKDSGKLQYLAQWLDSKLFEKDVRTRSDKSRYVRCDGVDWNVNAVENTEPEPSTGKPQLIVHWADTWRNIEDLWEREGRPEAKQAIREYEDSLPPHERSPLPDAIDPDTVIVSSELPARATITGDDPNIHFSACTSKKNGVQYGFDGRLLRPEKNVDYSHYLRSWIREMLGDSMTPQTRMLVDAEVVRPLKICDWFVDKRRTFNVHRDDRRNALLAYDSGDEQLVPCDCCGRRPGPFAACVVRDGYGNGACANCAHAGNSKQCNFHLDHVPHRRPITKHEHARDSGLDHPHSDSSQPSAASTWTADHSSVERRTRTSSTTPPSSPPKLGSSPLFASSNHKSSADLQIASRRPGELSSPKLCNNEQNPGLLVPPERRQLRSLTLSQQNTRSSGQERPGEFDSTTGRPLRSVFGNDSHQASENEARHDSEQESSSQAPKGKRRKINAEPAELPYTRPAPCRGRFRGDREQSSISFVETAASIKKGPTSRDAVVYNDMRFYSGQATSAQLLFILGRCLQCDHHFERAWQHLIKDRKASGHSPGIAKTRYLSLQFHEFINGAVAEHCPPRISALLAHAGDGSRDDPIALDE